MNAGNHLRLAAEALVQIRLSLGILALADQRFGRNQVQFRIIRAVQQCRLSDLHCACGIVVAEIDGREAEHSRRIAGGEGQRFRVLGLRVVRSIQLVIDIAEEDVASRGVGLELLEAR